MKNIIKLKSRGGYNNYLKRLKSDKQESKTYLLNVEIPTLRAGYTDSNNTKKFIDPSGGPFMAEGDFLEEAYATIKSIDFVAGYGWTITFE